jgi:3-oxoacyl-[acyl-carrier protein] reductase
MPAATTGGSLTSIFDFSGKTVLVTGGSGDIGRGIARMFAAHGASIAVNYVSSVDKAQATVDDIRARGGRAIAARANVAVEAEVEAMIGAVVEAFGSVDILVNNAGVRRKPGDNKYLLDVSAEEWDVEIDSHLRGMFLCCKAAVPHMIRRGEGRIVNVSSVMGRGSSAGASVQYPAAKSGMFGFSKALAHQLAHKHITVNCVAPGLIDTERVRWRSPEVLKEHVAKIPLGRLGRVEEVAAAVLYLASPLAAYVTGATLDINGGFYMG